MNKAVIALGSNIEPETNIKLARHKLAQNFDLVKESQFIKTKPVGYIEQPDFINGCILIETDLDQTQLKNKLKSIEREMGREKSPIKFGPRSIDLDITVFNTQIVDQDFYNREFVKKTTLEVYPSLNYERE